MTTPYWYHRMSHKQAEKVAILVDKGWHFLCINSKGEVVLYHYDTTNKHRIPRS